MTSFNYVGKKGRDVGITCTCYLSNIVPDSIFFDPITYGGDLYFKGWHSHCLPQYRRDGFTLITIALMEVGKP